MAFDLEAIRKELSEAPLLSPWPVFSRSGSRYEPDVAIAVVDDTFRLATRAPIPGKQWQQRRARGHKLWTEQVGMLAHVLATTSARGETVAALTAGDRTPESVLDRFFGGIRPLSAEMVRANRFRQEEFLRNWVASVDGSIEGETAKQSRQRLKQLDYGESLAEYKRAEAARKAEAGKRAKALREAKEREAAARGWRE